MDCNPDNLQWIPCDCCEGKYCEMQVCEDCDDVLAIECNCWRVIVPFGGRLRHPDRFTIGKINVRGRDYNKTMRDEQAEEIIEALKDYYANPEDYSLEDLEEIFQDRDPFEFL